MEISKSEYVHAFRARHTVAIPGLILVSLSSRRMPMSTLSLNDLYIAELRDLYDSENRLIKALPKLAEAAESPELRSGFELQLEQTKEHARRLEQIFQRMGKEPKRKKCPGMAGIIQEGDELMDEDYEE